jgi:glycosyltransferase involved in cell wall biosynthesis
VTDTVSVVIPTYDRPESLSRAIDSVLNQTHRDLEVIVVVDGPNRAIEDLLRSHADPRVRWIVNRTNLGTSGSRNAGVSASDGRWVGFLDDDDVWLPSKLSQQLALLTAARRPTIASGRIIRRTPDADFIGPAHPPAEGEPISEWLFRPRPPLEGATRFQPSAVLVPRELAVEVPWDARLPFYEGHDWLLRAAATGAPLVLAEEPVYIWNIHPSSISARHAGDWRGALEFIERRRNLVTPRAYAWFVLDRVATRASIAPDRPPITFLLGRARRHGRPSRVDIARYVVRMWLPWGVRQRLRRALSKVRKARR